MQLVIRNYNHVRLISHAEDNRISRLLQMVVVRQILDGQHKVVTPVGVLGCLYQVAGEGPAVTLGSVVLSDAFAETGVEFAEIPEDYLEQT